MILFIILALILLTQIIIRFSLKNKINNVINIFNQEFDKFQVIDNYKKKQTKSIFVSFLITLLVFSLPIALNIILYMHFPKEMVIGKMNLLFTFIILFSLFIVYDLIYTQILKCYVDEFKENNLNIEEDALPKLNLKYSIVNSSLNYINTVIIIIFIITIYIFM